MTCAHKTVVDSLVAYFYPDNLEVKLKTYSVHADAWEAAGKVVTRGVVPDGKAGNAPVLQTYVHLTWREYIAYKMDELQGRVDEERVIFSDINGQKFRWQDEDLSVKDWLGIWAAVKQKINHLTDPVKYPAPVAVFTAQTNRLQGMH